MRYLLAPRTFAKLVQLAEIDAEAVVLDVGCATGYSTAVLAKLAKRVIAVESDKGLAEQRATAAGGIGRRQCRGGRRAPRCRCAGAKHRSMPLS